MAKFYSETPTHEAGEPRRRLVRQDTPQIFDNSKFYTGECSHEILSGQTKWYLSEDVEAREQAEDLDTVRLLKDCAKLAEASCCPGRTSNRHSWHLDDKPTTNCAKFPNQLTNEQSNAKREPFSTILNSQTRASSSPSLCEQPIEQATDSTNKNEDKEEEENIENMPTALENHYRSSVLNKFKKTFTNFNKSYSPTAVSAAANLSPMSSTSQKSASTTPPAVSMAGEIDSSGKYRFGPLVWRTSKERRKTKYNRRDKCNSGDSGIQIEIDDGFGPDSIQEILSKTNQTSGSKSVRRAFSAKVTSISPTSSLAAKAKAMKKVDNCFESTAVTRRPIRSLSQPSGLDRISRNEPDESDTDSVSSHPDFHTISYNEDYNRPIYAEVLFAFNPVGPQELRLERGALVQVLRKENGGGPWWYGRIKYDAILEKKFEVQEGWFPKEFVRVLKSIFDNEMEAPISTSAASPTVPTTRLPEELIKNSVSTLNENNVTTIVVDSSPDVAPSSATSTAADKNSSMLLPSQRNSQTNSTMSDSSNIHSLNSTESLRNSVIKELLETEINYEKLLSSLCLGFIPQMRRRIDIFSTESLNLIFSNIECIWRFQQNFLDALKSGIETDRIAKVFLEHQTDFMVYSAYCNSYPRALMELESYSRSKDAKKVLENCRVAENLPELPLSAHLLAPIQRICRYPLQLSELIKHTDVEYSCISKYRNTHSNHQSQLVEDIDEIDSSFLDVIDSKDSLELALNAMKKVTETVNEGKRHSEHLARFQSSFENFQGPPLHFHSTRFFMQTDATRVSPNLWNNTYTLFLFDHQLIYCKKDLLKRNHFIFKGRIFLDNCRILNLPDGKIFGATVKNALRIYCESRHKWFDFSFRSASRKLRFLSTLAAERQFCGKSLFISEFAGGPGTVDDDDCAFDYHSDCDTTPSSENIYDIQRMSPAKFHKYSAETLPKKSKNSIEYNSSSLGRRKLGNWFRKSKSTNSTPNQSPTHSIHPQIISSTSGSEFKLPPPPIQQHTHTPSSSLSSTTSSMS